MSVTIGINGFGRIGRYLTRLLSGHENLRLVTVNDLMSAEDATHLLRYDSAHGRFMDAKSVEGGFMLKDSFVSVTQKACHKWDWSECDIVIEAAGCFSAREHCQQHMACGAKKVIVACPAPEADVTIVMGVNEQDLHADHHIISNASCTTNCLALPLYHLHNHFGVKRGYMTTIHPVTQRQMLLDDDYPDLRRARACHMNILPTPVGTTETVAEVIPDMKGRLQGIAYRVPTVSVAMIDCVLELETSTTVEEVNRVLREAANDHLGYTEAPLVSSDFNGSTFGSIVDGQLTAVQDGTMLKLVAWYDNEASFSNQLLRLTEKVARMIEEEKQLKGGMPSAV
ncbi:type I glyceraldehyde-3-phosphate dehydrogenase [Halodesulfovibrio marinisediminis]|uniref:Glyceraldehyde 3-phosphate dehydrogenase n=1 Tax=Halodesulfovibrio marinisediminis DSM 17456 TaxID=1121457 RepID=A0A1N6DCV7_9BACT|nr:glyceraldehyde 3-phosphate dehydrogenase NAD-binding domain-containing protein [Halodesulfovibrio marinisediminis]SIN68641.1 glyceraldehyde 3-phosphate dehydrogenase [Halodesulfovibrio marinisediminis DSM 17456]